MPAVDLRAMTWFVRVAGLYNASAVVVLLTPGFLELLDVREPHSPFWVWLPALTGLFAGIVLLLSSMDLRTYGAFPYWNGIIRVAFVAAAFSLDFGSSAGDVRRTAGAGRHPARHRRHLRPAARARPVALGASDEPEATRAPSRWRARIRGGKRGGIVTGGRDRAR